MLRRRRWPDQVTDTLAFAPVPALFDARSEYKTVPACWPTGEQESVAVLHSAIARHASGVNASHASHSYFATGPLQVLVNASGEPSRGVVVLATTVHDGAAVAAGCQFIVTVEGAPGPLPFVATMPYTTGPAALAVAVQVGAYELQLIHAYVAGEPVHEAVMTSGVPRTGNIVLADSVQLGASAAGCAGAMFAEQKMTGRGPPIPSST